MAYIHVKKSESLLAIHAKLDGHKLVDAKGGEHKYVPRCMRCLGTAQQRVCVTLFLSTLVFKVSDVQQLAGRRNIKCEYARESVNIV